MSNLYEISQVLLYIFQQIEDNDGEITPIIEEELKIHQDDYKNKLENYAKVIKNYESDIAGIKAETKRLNNRKEILENRIDRLKKVMLDAVEQFGPVETNLFKIGTRKSTSIDTDNIRIEQLTRGVMNFAREIHDNGVIAFGKDCDIQGMLDVVNANLKSQHDAALVLGYENNEFIPFTIDDLNSIRVEISASSIISDLFTNKDGMLETVLDNETSFNISDDTNKTELKEKFKNYNNITIGKSITKNQLSIK